MDDDNDNDNDQKKRKRRRIDSSVIPEYKLLYILGSKDNDSCDEDEEVSIGSEDTLDDDDDDDNNSDDGVVDWKEMNNVIYESFFFEMSRKVYDNSDEGIADLQNVFEEQEKNGHGPVDKIPIAYLLCRFVSVPEILQLYVHPEHRDSGLGTQLVSRIKEICRKKKTKVIQVYAVDSSSFYKKCGFRGIQCKDNFGKSRRLMEYNFP